MVSTSTDHLETGSWVSAIRTIMANDPGRQLLEDQIQTDGFLFLEDYLEGILARPRHDPIIELVKTPARRRNAPKTRGATATAMTKPVITMDLDELDSDKENETPTASSMPINAFHKALLQSKDSTVTTPRQQASRNALRPMDCKSSLKLALPKRRPGTDDDEVAPTTATPGLVLTDDEEREEKVEEKLGTPPHLGSPPLRDCAGAPPNPVVESRLELSAAPRPEPVTELSIIAEMDESAERSRNIITAPPVEDAVAFSQTSNTMTRKNANSPKPYVKRTPDIDLTAVMDIEDITQTMNFNAMSTPVEPPWTTLRNSPVAAHVATPDAVVVASTSGGPGFAESKPVSNDVEEYFPSDEPPAGDSSKDQAHEAHLRKPTISEFPTIGPPSPLRKSIRATKEPLPATSYASAVTKQTTTRSSWLVKAKEAKAMEDNTRKLTVMATLAHRSGAGSKRKSGDMLDSEWLGLQQDNEGRTQKFTRIAETSPVQARLKEQEILSFGRFRDETVSVVDDEVREILVSADGSDGMIDKLKKTVAGFSARAGRSMGKSLGGAAATALAEARAAAEAKVAERNAVEGRIVATSTSALSQESDELEAVVPDYISALATESSVEKTNSTSSDNDRRLSVSELVSASDAKKSKIVGRIFYPPNSEQSKPPIATTANKATANTSTSTTPPNSPPKNRSPIFTLPGKPKLQPVQTFPPSTYTFSRVEPQPFELSRVPRHIDSQSTYFSTQSTYSDAILDPEMPAWVPSTQDTDLSDHGPARSSLREAISGHAKDSDVDMDPDESWHLDENFAETWTPVAFHMKDESMTWGTALSRSTRSGDTGVLDTPVPSKSGATEEPNSRNAPFESIPSDIPLCTTTDEIDEEDMDVDFGEDVASVRLVTPAAQSEGSRFSTRPGGQQTREEDQPSSGNTRGFFSSASRLVSSVLGGSKKGREPVKSLQLAAVAAKRQQEEAEKKANRLKEMEARRQQILQKRAEEDKAREARRAKKEDERWRREREKEEPNEKRVVKQPGKKLEEDMAKKRKNIETDKKVEPKKPTAKDRKDAPVTKIGKFTTSQSGKCAASLSSKPLKQIGSTVVQGSKVANAPNDTRLGYEIEKAKAPDAESGIKQPSQLVQSQMQARYQAQLGDSRKARMPPPPVPTETIELPDINSEYSDSDDENRVRTFDPPDWAQSPELREALESQRTVNPDDIFGAIRPLKMEELFKNRTSRFRARTSSANWAGPDGLTIHEEMEYARRMGYQQ